MIFARKIFFTIFLGGGARVPCPPLVSFAYAEPLASWLNRPWKKLEAWESSTDHQRRRVDDGDVERKRVEFDAVLRPGDQGQLPASAGAWERRAVYGR